MSAGSPFNRMVRRGLTITGVQPPTDDEVRRFAEMGLSVGCSWGIWRLPKPGESPMRLVSARRGGGIHGR